MSSMPFSREQAARAAEEMRHYAQPQRLLILSLLLQGEHNVGDIETLTGIAQPGLSQQLGALRQAGITVTRRHARQIFYRLAGPFYAERVQALLMLFGSQPVPAKERPMERLTAPSAEQQSPSPAPFSSPASRIPRRGPPRTADGSAIFAKIA